MSRKTKDWILALAYVLFIYLTLEIVPRPLAYLRSHGILRLSLAILYTTCLVLIFSYYFSRSDRSAIQLMGLLFTVGGFFFVARYIRTPEEQTHFLEYGLVGVFFFRALRHHTGNSLTTFALAFVLGSIAGIIDEIIQGFLPSRHYDMRDVFLNMVSIFLGLTLVRLVFWPSQSKS